MGYYADTEKGAMENNGYYECVIIEEVGDCWKVRFCGVSEIDLVQPPLMNMSRTSTPLMTKTMVYQVGEVSSGPGPPMHQAFRLKYIGNEVALRSVGVAHRHAKALHRISVMHYSTFCSQIRVLIACLNMHNGPKKWRRLVTGHMKLNTYLMGVSGYPGVVVNLVSEAMLVMANTRASE